MLYTGIDIIEIDRVQSVAERYGERFLKRVYTEGERAYCRGRAPQLAARFAAKEAAMIALGSGVRGVAWREVEVVRLPGRAPEIVLHGRAQKRAERMSLERLALSISHSRRYAVASVVANSVESAVPS